MSLTPEELEGIINGNTRTIIKTLLARRKPGDMNITDIEQLVLQAGDQFEEMLTEALIEAEEAEWEGVQPTCPECGGKLNRLIGTGAGIILKGNSSRRSEDYRLPHLG